MTQYINKSALIAKIACKADVAHGKKYPDGKNVEVIYQFQQLIKFLDTLEVKEIDFEKEFDNYAKDITACDVQFEPFTHLYECAKYFFELGLKTQEGE